MILITSCLFLSVLTILSLALFMDGLLYGRNAVRGIMNTIAFALAEGGLDDAIGELQKDSSYTGTGPICQEVWGGKGCYKTEVSLVDGHDSLREITATGYAASSPPYDDPSSPFQQTRQIKAIVSVGSMEGLFPFTLFFEDDVVFPRRKPNNFNNFVEMRVWNQTA